METLIAHPLTVGVETVALRTEVGRPTDRVLSEMDRKTSRAVTTFLPSHLPAGVSYFGIHHTPKGWALHAEANLTTVLHGAGSEVGSLSAGEVPLALDRLILVLRSVVPALDLPLMPWRYDVTRFDPSTTLRFDDPASVITTAHANWRTLRSGKQTLSLHDSGGMTATLVLSRALSHMVYDKKAVSDRQGKDCPVGAVRLEARVRPKKGIPLSATEELVGQSSEQLMAIARAIGPVVQSAGLVTARTFIEAQKALGEEPDPAEAFALVGYFTVMDSSLNVRPLIENGISPATAYRRRARIRELLSVADEDLQDRAAMDVFSGAEVVLARQLLEAHG